ncbi:MAG: nitrite/sulfite reductase [Actinomycetota bacterium]
MNEKPLWQQKIDVESVKAGDLDPDLARLEREGYETLTGEEFYRLKTWGVCSQRTPGLHMIRIRVPGGAIAAAQLRGLAAVSAGNADGTVHITTRQNAELHSVPSRKVRGTLEGIWALGLQTRSACGHAVRNIVGCSLAGICADETLDIRPTVKALHDFTIARASHYNARLPRRINVYVAGCATCQGHAQINDLGFVATRRGGEPGFQVWCAGSLGSSPRLAHLLFGFVPPEEVLAVTEAVMDVYCEHGFRDRSAKARLKFLVEEWGIDRFADAVVARLHEIRATTRVARNGLLPILGPARRPQGGHRGVFVQRQAGYVRVEARVRLGDLTGEQMEVLSSLADSHADGSVHLTREQNAELHWIRHDDAGEVTGALADAGLFPRGAGGLVDVQVCAGTEWCVWGIGDSRGLARTIEESLADVVADDPDAEPLRVHISGCSHGCAQHQVADVGLAAVSVRSDGAAGEGFEIFGGGRLGAEPVIGRRLGKVPLDESEPEVIGLLRRYLSAREPNEDVSEFVERTGHLAGAEEVAR